MINSLFTFMIIAYTFGALLALLYGKDELGRLLTALCSLLGAGAGLVMAVSVIANHGLLTVSLAGLLPIAGGFELALDPLGAFFLLLIGVVAIPAAIYGFGYTAQYEKEPVSLPLLGVMFNLFLLSMSLVTMAANVLTFLILWEAMSLTSYFLVITENHEEGTMPAGLWYAGMTHAGLALLLAAFLLLANGGTGSFASLRAASAALPAATRNIIFVLAFLGFGSKAGIVPLHIWLPKAHPAAPAMCRP